jgi:hypothetical protein
MLDDAVNGKRAEGQAANVKVIDIAQVIADSIGLRKLQPAMAGAPAAEAEAEAAAPETSGGPGAPSDPTASEPTPEQPLEASTTTEVGPTIDPSSRRPDDHVEPVVDEGDTSGS